MFKIFALLLALLLWLPAQAQQQVEVYTNTTPTLFTSVTIANATGATNVTLTNPSSEITILSSPGGANNYVTFSGTATTSNFEIPAGYAFTFSGFPSITNFSIIGDGTTGTHSVFAH